MGGDPNQLGPFVLIEKLGEGGMGVVYKARDTRLDRLVAIKLLPESRVTDPDRRARFMQEARAASALNHPGIVTIHDIAEKDGRHYIVMEFVDGKPLGELIPQKGMPVKEVLRLAVQIGDALAAAHAAGIVHRDLKPGNIMVDAAGRSKVLDFGLAKLMAASAASEAADETVTVAMSPRTEEGAIIGSVPYMSPEQAEGRRLDARSDIFSFGAVLYEMITGQRAFPGESRISTLAAIVEREPRAISESLPNVPVELERIVSRCLRKDITRRSQNMTDVRIALEELRDEAAAASSKSAGLNGRRWLWPAVAAACAALAAVAVVWRRGDVPAPPAQLVRVSPDDGHSYLWPAISPDGKFVAMVSERRAGSPACWFRARYWHRRFRRTASKLRT